MINIYNVFPRYVKNNKEMYEMIVGAKDMGFDSVYFNPFFRTGESKNIYAIADYYQFDELSFDNDKNMDMQVKEWITVCNKNGMRPIVDLVVNHTAVDSELVKIHPDFYCYENSRIKTPTGRDIGKTLIWHDSAQLDYTNIQSGLWDYMLDVCKFYIQLGFRGFRCDAADQINLAFWMWLVREIKKIDEDILFIGEAYLCPENTRIGLAYAGFDYLYNSSKWWDYKSEWLLAEQELFSKYIKSISFPDNHDSIRLMSETCGNMALFLMRLYFTAFWSYGFEITIGMEFGEFVQLDNVETQRSLCFSENRTDRYNFTRHIKEIIKVRKEVMEGQNWETKDCARKTDVKDSFVRVYFENMKYGFEMDFSNMSFTVRKQYDENNVRMWEFNCINPEPSISFGYEVISERFY